MTKIHTIADESLGGVLREYVEVDWKADVGDYVIIVNAESDSYHFGEYRNGDIAIIKRFRNDDSQVGVYAETTLIDGEDAQLYAHEYNALEPTDIVQIDDRRFRLVERKAEIGEDVLVIDDACNQYDFGGVYTVACVDYHAHIPSKNGGLVFMEDYEYYVLVPIEQDDQPIEAHADDPDSIIDLLANLARRVTELEAELNERKRVDEKLDADIHAESQRHMYRQQETERVWEKLQGLAKITEANTDDIADLDERIIELEEGASAKQTDVVTYEKFLDAVADKVAERLVGR
ncbi:hypothetical protein [Bacillus sp. 03113]|uniref:hypothetical protein n=1 Tax=Bacillus sp. 03113 TaxID=2578211 RepID=UPI001144AC02|nr:hypothetical protein [Bacillus sp. 03113]